VGGRLSGIVVLPTRRWNQGRVLQWLKFIGNGEIMAIAIIDQRRVFTIGLVLAVARR